MKSYLDYTEQNNGKNKTRLVFVLSKNTGD